jgi:hypothetical protein
VKVDVTQRNQNPTALLPEKCEPEVPNNFRERSLKKELGGETNDTEGDDDHKKKENYSAEFRHGSITPSVNDLDDASTQKSSAPEVAIGRSRRLSLSPETSRITRSSSDDGLPRPS